MKTPSVLLIAAVLSLPAAAQGPDRVATVTGRVITRAELAAGTPAVSPEARLLERIWPFIASDYVAGHGLAASPAEIEEALAYQREFERRDRAQRWRKLEELAGRLAEAELAPEERARLEDFQATLQRLARQDEQQTGRTALRRAPARPRGAPCGEVEAQPFALRALWRGGGALRRRPDALRRARGPGHGL
jgi:hypothetical protein